MRVFSWILGKLNRLLRGNEFLKKVLLTIKLRILDSYVTAIILAIFIATILFPLMFLKDKYDLHVSGKLSKEKCQQWRNYFQGNFTSELP